ncbi:MAG: DNA (cytosine-5-)-methyltransferase [Clostridium saudiense]|uniref:DNA (cytosine-5-)-methyltransferase n=1 Tax=Clostridium saudiense TaxID=1414720 RepID=UPI00290EA725|nr:DNA (cytosine-5-)-methyltransferase [Clostridium saudiense]MDU3521751.1 DNA (cytosine-5-)-methyltransferase [Clostridium saudiense]
MLRVVESFSGIGSQVKALKNIGVEHEIVATIDWDINAIIAYDIIHNGKPNLQEYKTLSKNELVEILKKYKLSSNGKEPLTLSGLKRMSKIELEHLLAAIKRSKNLTSITEVKGSDLPKEIDLFTYSFPCQDLSIAGAWHGNNSGIDRNANNRSGMLWEVERILFERRNSKLELPKFLLMENVSNILSNTHKKNFNEWKSILEEMGYFNVVYTLNAQDFGIPQKRKRVYMLSIQYKNENVKKILEEYINNNNLNDGFYRDKLNIKQKKIDEILRIDYDKNDIYREEANNSQPNNTPSRIKIYEENDRIYDGNNKFIDIISTITTKQDRNPNSGVIDYNSGIIDKCRFRYLTPRECFMLMGFDEKDFQILVDNDFYIGKNKNFFVYSKLYKLAGNSIVVNVLEYIFKQVEYINDNILN